MKQIITIFFIVLSIISSSGQIFNDITKPSLSNKSLAEKVYLQIDNAIYQTGETIWYKAVVTKSLDNSLSDLSRVLHVELIGADQKVIGHQLLKLNDGIANGSFILEKSYKPGKYHIRAYTKWNRNFDKDFMFSQPLNIVNLEGVIEKQKPIINIVVGTGDYKSLQADIDPRLVNTNFKGKLKLYVDTNNRLDSLLLQKTKDNIYQLDYKLPHDAVQAELKFDIQTEKRFKTDDKDFYRETIIIDQNHLDLQFFPEGGKLVGGLLSSVGFKAVDYNGLGYTVTGTIKDHEDKEITSFSSNDLGMGTFKLQPEVGAFYYAEIRKDDITYRYDLPKSTVNGSVLTVVNMQDELRLSIRSKDQRSKYLTVEASSRGVKYQSFKFKQKDTIVAAIPKLSLPDGIIKIAVRNDKNQKLCERLFFNNIESQRLNISISSDKISYSQRDKVSVRIGLDSVQDKLTTSLSVLVLDKERTEISKNYKPGILPYLLVNSELKGFVEQPHHYFNSLNRSRYSDLDALMLTQGWRNYNYNNAKPLTTFTYKPETSLELSGTIGEYFNPDKRPKEPLNLNLMIQDDMPHAYSLEIPESGKYHFQVDDIYKPNTEFFMQVVDNKGEPVDFKINLDKKWQPNIESKSETTFRLPSAIKTNFTEQMEVVNEIQQKYETTYNTIALDEVNIKGYKLTPAREAFIEIHGEPTTVIDGKELNKNPPKWNFGVLSVIRAQFPDKVMIIDEGPRNSPFLRAVVRGTEYAGGFTYILVDNIPIAIREYQFVQSIPVEEVTGIDILESPRNKNEYCYEVLKPAGNCPTYVALINIYTKSGKGINGIVKTKGFKIDEMKGFSESVEFYTPNYETLSSQDWVIPDNRSVIYWEPNLTSNDQGEYVLEFYNDDHIGEVSVIVEAISKDGKIGYKEQTYTIKEAER